MLDIKEIESFYPEYLMPFKKNLLREYIQCKILETVFSSGFGDKLSFMGGTATHLIYGNTRFSEDLDFDNLGLNKNDFRQLSGLIKRRLQLEGYSLEVKDVFRGAYHAYIKIKDILFEYGISSHKYEKLVIRIDTEPQEFEYRQDKPIINRFDVFGRVSVVPIDILLSQKICAIFTRKRAMGRDFYDVIFLLGKTKLNMDYLKLKLKVKDKDDLKEKLLFKCSELDFKRLSRDVKPFLFKPADAGKILLFADYVKSVL